MTELNSLPSYWKVFNNAEEVAEAVTESILQAAEKAIAARGIFHLITAGGSTPNRCYELLAKSSADWQHWHIYMGDERCLPVDDAERNSVSLHQSWLHFGKIPQQNIHFIPAELGLDLAAKAYSEVVQKIDCFDLVLLGMGEDGHTASLFPGHLYENESVVKEYYSPKPPSHRISLSFQQLCKSRQVFKVLTGTSKREAVKQWLAGEELPITKVEGSEQTLVWLDSAVL